VKIRDRVQATKGLGYHCIDIVADQVKHRQATLFD
jgi:hypothetical protein